MIKLTNKLYGASLVALAFSLNAINVNAQTCTTAPSCTTLGFTKSATDCDGHSILKCPFDQTKVYCDTGSGSNTSTPSCPTGYFPYNDLYPTCNETDRNKMEEHYSSKGCYKCKKCSEGFWFDAGFCALGSSKTDSAGCQACSACSWSNQTVVNGRCI